MKNLESQPPGEEETEQSARTEVPEKPGDLLEREAALKEAYEERQKTLEQRISELRQEVVKKRVEAGWAQKMIDSLEDRITVVQSKTLGKVFNFLEIQRLRREMGIEQVKFEEAQKDFNTAVNLLKEMESQLADRRELDEVEKMISEFYKEQEEAIRAREEEEQVRDIEKISRENGALFVHNFWRPRGPRELGYAVGPTSVVERETKWQTKLKILLGLEPQICTGAVREEHTGDHPYWNDVGVILKGGKMRAAGVSGSRVFGGAREEKQTVEQLRDTIKSTIDGETTNEFVVERPKVAGIFVPDNQSSFQGGYGRDSENPIHSFDLAREISEEAGKLGIPVYVRKEGDGMDGKFYKAQWDAKTGKLVAGDPISHEEILDNDFQVREEDRQTLREEIFEDSPFKLEAFRRGEGKISEADLKHITTG